ncbi:ABC transporter ATP-binding protein/permease [Bacillus sp. DX1.1]|uniref:ABC transporter ATP-binding protein/permease n=1 Tax=unclassified Bacillus (in: firmicutes) TaxID=185979 RepID=UPI00256FFC82|nr:MULTISPECIES: ABC transporter ATP-binding protein/permease [unclassified Bacillus (in: firmicutes)]MDM5152708.1 ABC transporter ATP-binding protein/permease [Bacillus sp. DX1.1]WJE84395.1 ABC transporter ATP-binding protein/permease [Bacillus sp. DX3.1]
MFQIKNVYKQYKNGFALYNVSMNINKGLNFIVGASGSGKTTLLKIISGMEQDFDGEVLYCGKNIKDLTNNEKSYFYNNIFGFVWQDFNLLEEATVLENVLLSGYLKEAQNKENAEKILKDLKIFNFAQKKVKDLSGGQKQRVAIARELMKNPQVIIADEPTSALDEKNAKITMDILRAISKNRTVIVVTHDTSLISEKDHIFELDKGELFSKSEIQFTKTPTLKMQSRPNLSLKNSLVLAKSNIKNKFGRFVVATLSFMVAAILLLTTVNGAINNESQAEFDKLFDTYGEGMLNITVVDSFTSASGSDGNKDEKPNADVTQKIGGLYEQYVNDERVKFTLFEQSFNNIRIDVDGKEHEVERTGSAPYINKLLAGKMPMGNSNEIVVPESFVKKLGIGNEQVIGKEITFNGSVFNGSVSNGNSGEPILKDVSIKAKIVGVIDTKVVYEYNGKTTDHYINDAFFFSKTALDEMGKQAEINNEQMNFIIRAKTPTDMISIKDELNTKGIVPLGDFERVEDIVRLNAQTTEQTESASLSINLLSVVMVIAIFLITGIMRKREYAIYKISGYNNKHLSLLIFTEIFITTATAILFLLVTSPLINLVTKAEFSVNILSAKMLFTGVLMLMGVAVVAFGVTITTFVKLNVSAVLKTGDR